MNVIRRTKIADLRWWICLLGVIVAVSCQNRAQVREKTPTVDSLWQQNVSDFLSVRLQGSQVLSGKIVVMETRTGEVKLSVGVECAPDGSCTEFCNFANIQVIGELMYPISLLAALEDEKVTDEDQGSEIVVNRCATTVAACISQGYDYSPELFYKRLNNMGFRFMVYEADLRKNSVGEELEASPIHVLSFYNAIANNGTMVQPLFFKGSAEILNSQIVDKRHLDFTKGVLTEHFIKNSSVSYLPVAGMNGTACLRSTTGKTVRSASFCGYFPVDNPQYSVLVSVNTSGNVDAAGQLVNEILAKVVQHGAEE